MGSFIKITIFLFSYILFNSVHAQVPLYPHKEWSYTFHQNVIWNLQTDAESNVYFLTGTRDDDPANNALISLNANGKERWHLNIPVDDHQLYLNKLEHEIYLFNVDSKVLLVYDFNGKQIFQTGLKNDLVRQSIYLLDNKYLVSPNFDKALVYNLRGKKLIELEIENELGPYSIDENLNVYTGESSRNHLKLIARDKNQKLLWDYELGAGQMSQPVVMNHQIYVRFKPFDDKNKLGKHILFTCTPSRCTPSTLHSCSLPYDLH